MGNHPSEGIVELVGAGPGDPGLLTRRGAEALATADAVVYDHLIHPRLLDLAPVSAERHPVGKRAGHLIKTQEEIHAILIDLARRGLRVVRLKGGDPFVFGRGGEEAEALARAGVRFRVTPGVTAGLGATAYAGIPVTHRDSASAVAFVTGHGEPGESESRLDWDALARFPGTLVIYMGVTRLRAICEALVRGGRSPVTPAALIQSGTLGSQRVATANLRDLPGRAVEAGLGPPALLVVGEVVARAEGIDWFTRLPLFGRRVVVTRPSDESDRSATDLEALGAEVIVAPTVAILPIEGGGPLDSAIARLESFHWLGFTSGNGVRHFLKRLDGLGFDLRALGPIKLAAIGPATAEALRSAGLRADLVPPSFRSEGLAEAMVPLVQGRRVLLIRADRGRDVLREILAEVAEVEQVAAYRNVDAHALPAGVDDRIARGGVDWVTLTSSAIADRFHGLLSVAARDRIARGEVRLASLSPVTSSAIQGLGWPVGVEAARHDWPGLIAAILDAETIKTV